MINQNKKKILYLYDIENWAIHNVGRFWAELVSDDYEFIFLQCDDFIKTHSLDFDLICWGYSELFSRVIKNRYLNKFTPTFLAKYIVGNKHISIVHDPCELFPQVENWRQSEIQYNYLKWFDRFAVISNEMQGIMKTHGFDCIKINTDSSLPLRDHNDIDDTTLKCFSKAYEYQRKNLSLFYKIQKHFKKSKIEVNDYFGRLVLPKSKYIDLIDAHNCYICTSWQEGGPIPVMDAMRRGAVILTTPVGQTDELVEDGVNGFFCKTFEEFIEKIDFLHHHPKTRLQMQHNSIDSVEEKSALIKKQLHEFL